MKYLSSIHSDWEIVLHHFFLKILLYDLLMNYYGNCFMQKLLQQYLKVSFFYLSSFSVNGEFSQYKPMDVLLTSEGQVTWYAPVILTTSCKVNVRYFPFDRQHCQLRFASWIYDMSKLDILYLNDSDALQTVFYSNGVWNLHKVVASRIEHNYTCCPYPYVFVTFNLILKRGSGFYVFNIVIPCVLLAILTLMVFCLPHDSGEKISFGTTNLLALILYQQLIADSMPPLGDEFPLVGKRISLLFVLMVATGCFLSIGQMYC